MKTDDLIELGGCLDRLEVLLTSATQEIAQENEVLGRCLAVVQDNIISIGRRYVDIVSATKTTREFEIWKKEILRQRDSGEEIDFFGALEKAEKGDDNGSLSG